MQRRHGSSPRRRFLSQRQDDRRPGSRDVGCSGEGGDHAVDGGRPMSPLERGGQAPDRCGELLAGDVGGADGAAQRDQREPGVQLEAPASRAPGGACLGCRAGSAPASFFFAQLAKYRRIFPESPRCWGRAKTHDRAIVHSRISAARSRLRMIRLAGRCAGSEPDRRELR